MKRQQTKIPHCKNIAVASLNIVALINNGHRPNATKQVGTPRKLNITFLKHTPLLLLLFILGFGSELKAQESVDKEVKPHKWEIGLDIIPFLREESPFDLVIKKTFKDKNKALRFRATPQYSRYKNKTFPNIGGVSKVNASFDIGIEKRHSFGKFLLYYGSDLNFICNIDISNIGLGINQQSPSLVRSYYRNVGFGASGLVGGKYFFNHRFSLSAESNLAIYRNWVRRETGTVDYNLRPINLLIEEASGINLSLKGINSIFLSYYF